MYYDAYQNHKWAKNLAHARRLLEGGRLEPFYRGEDLPDGDVYAGMRVMAAYWVSVEHEMPLRLAALLRDAVDATAEEFMWDVSRAFFADVLPAAGFEDIGDLMELGLRGMYAEQYFETGQERQVGEAGIRQSILHNCELAGIYWRVAEWRGLPRLALGYGICRYCEVHGLATMMITLPPMTCRAS